MLKNCIIFMHHNVGFKINLYDNIVYLDWKKISRIIVQLQCPTNNDFIYERRILDFLKSFNGGIIL